LHFRDALSGVEIQAVASPILQPRQGISSLRHTDTYLGTGGSGLSAVPWPPGSLAGLFVVAMIGLSSILAGREAIDRLLHPRDVSHLWAVAAAGVIGFIGNELVAQYRIRVGRQIGSAALVADGLHPRTDGFTSLAVVAGAIGVAAGLPWADPVVGLLIAIAILGGLRSAVMQVGARLMDAVTPDIIHTAREVPGTVDCVLEVRSLRWIGHTLHADGGITVPADLPVAAGHDIAHHAEEHLLEVLPRLTSALIHVSHDGAHHEPHGKAAPPLGAEPPAPADAAMTYIENRPVIE